MGLIERAVEGARGSLIPVKLKNRRSTLGWRRRIMPSEEETGVGREVHWGQGVQRHWHYTPILSVSYKISENIRVKINIVIRFVCTACVCLQIAQASTISTKNEDVSSVSSKIGVSSQKPERAGFSLGAAN